MATMNISDKHAINFNESDKAEAIELAKMLALTDVYGGLAKEVRLSITLTKNYIEMIEKVLPDLDEPELDLLLTSVKRLKLNKYKARKIAEIEKEGQKV